MRCPDSTRAGISRTAQILIRRGIVVRMAGRAAGRTAGWAAWMRARSAGHAPPRTWGGDCRRAADGHGSAPEILRHAFPAATGPGVASYPGRLAILYRGSLAARIPAPSGRHDLIGAATALYAPGSGSARVYGAPAAAMPFRGEAASRRVVRPAIALQQFRGPPGCRHSGAVGQGGRRGYGKRWRSPARQSFG